MDMKFRDEIKEAIKNCNNTEELKAILKEEKHVINGVKMSTTVAYLNSLIINSLPDEFTEEEQLSLLYYASIVDDKHLDKYMNTVSELLEDICMNHTISLVEYMNKLTNLDNFLSDNANGINRNYGEEYKKSWELMPTKDRYKMVNIIKAEVLTRMNAIFYYFTDILDGVVMHTINGEDQMRLIHYNQELKDLCIHKKWINKSDNAMEICAAKDVAGDRVYEIIREEKIEPFYSILKAGSGWRRDQFLDTILGLGLKPFYNSYSKSMTEIPIRKMNGDITKMRTRRKGSFIFPHVIEQGWLEGVTDKVSRYIDRSTGRAAQAILKLKTQDAGAKTKTIYIMSQAINFSKDSHYTCDSVITNTFSLGRGKKFKSNVRRILGLTMVQNSKDVIIHSKYEQALKQLSYLEGTDIEIFTPLTCNGITRGKGICRRCAGSVIYDNNARTHLGRQDHVGATFGRQLGQPVQQVIISVKHMSVGNPVAPVFRLIELDGKEMDKKWDIDLGDITRLTNFNVDGEVKSVRFDSGERVDGVNPKSTDYIKEEGKGACVQYLPWTNTPYIHTQRFTVTTDEHIYTFESDVQLYIDMQDAVDVDGNHPLGIHYGTKDYFLKGGLDKVDIYALISNAGVTALYDNVNLIDNDTDKSGTPSYQETVDRVLNLKDDYHTSVTSIIFKALIRDKNNNIADTSDPDVELKFATSNTANSSSGRFTGVLPGGYLKNILNNDSLYDISKMHADEIDKILNY